MSLKTWKPNFLLAQIQGTTDHALCFRQKCWILPLYRGL